MRTVAKTLAISDALDRRFAQLRGEMATSKERSLIELARLFAAERVRYAVIGGIAVQIWSAEPRTTLDIDVAVVSYDDLPRDAMRRAGFVVGERFEHSENWTGPDGTPVQFSDDPAFSQAVAHATSHPVGDTVLRVAAVLELVRAKLRAARDPARRRSKRLMDRADAVALTEQHPFVIEALSAADRGLLDADDPSVPPA
jgi:hypothetical protein